MVRMHHSTDRTSRENPVGLGMPVFGKPPKWTTSAHCLDHPEWGPDTWHEKGYERSAAEVCNGSYREGKPCPVRRQCLEFALENGFKTGVWGGMWGKPLLEWIERVALARKAEEQLEKLAAEAKCGRGHWLTPDNLTPKRRCLTCVKDEAVFWRRRNELVRQGELPAAGS